MKYIFSLFIVLTFLMNVNAQLQKQNKEFAEIINSHKKNKSGKAFQVDSTYSIVLTSHEIIKKENDLIDKDHLRNELRKKHRYDYDIEVIKMRYKDIGDFETLISLSEDPKLKKILSDTLYNRLGVSLSKINNKNYAFLLVSKNVIEFDPEFQLDIKITSGGVEYSKRISGRSSVENIQYNIYYQNKSIRTEKLINQRIVLNENGRFEIVIPYDNSDDEPPLYLDLCDQDKKVVSKIKIK